VVLAWWLGGCVFYPDASERYNDDVIATGYDKDVTFSELRTFAVDPTIHITAANSDGSMVETGMEASLADPIVAEIVMNMTNAGYEQVMMPAGRPDVGITITGLRTTVSGTVSSWWGYGGYWGYPYYGYYYPYSYTYDYNAGSMITEMVDLTKTSVVGGMPPAVGGTDTAQMPAQPEAGNPSGIPVIWASIAYKVLDSNGQPNTQWATQSIDQAFAQSPYLRRQ